MHWISWLDDFNENWYSMNKNEFPVKWLINFAGNFILSNLLGSNGVRYTPWNGVLLGTGGPFNMAGVFSCTRGPSIFSAVFSALFVMLVSENKINKIKNCRM